MNRNDMIVKWVVDKINREYKDDVSLLLTYGSYINGTGTERSDVDFYFIPRTDRAYELCKTFIIDGIGFDLFPMSWERIGTIVDFNDHLTPLVVDVKVLYSYSDEELEKFNNLQNILQFNLNNKPFMTKKANDKIDLAFDEFKKLIFSNNISDVRLYSGTLALILADAVAYTNQTYFSRGLKMLMEDLKNMKELPENFLEIYDVIMKSTNQREIKEISFDMINKTKIFINQHSEKSEKIREMDLEYLAEFYEEGISTWNRIEICCDKNDYKLAYIAGISLQKELDIVTKENGLNKFDIMTSYDANDLSAYKENALKLKEKFRKIIEDNGHHIEEYKNIEEFLEKN